MRAEGGTNLRIFFAAFYARCVAFESVKHSVPRIPKPGTQNYGLLDGIGNLLRQFKICSTKIMHGIP